jgi:hypothetical protein
MVQGPGKGMEGSWNPGSGKAGLVVELIVGIMGKHVHNLSGKSIQHLKYGGYLFLWIE